MTAPPARKRKTNLKERFNQFLDDVFTAGPSFSMNTIKRYEAAAVAARERDLVRTSTPVKSDDSIGEMVFKRVEASGMEEISRQMTDDAVEAAIRLGEKFELSATGGRRLNMREWVES